MSGKSKKQTKESALSRILGTVAKGMGKPVAYTVALLGLVSLFPGVELPALLQVLAGSVGIEIIGSLIDRVVFGEDISEETIINEVERALTQSGLEDLLTKDDFYHAFAHIRKGQTKLHKDNIGILQALSRLEELVLVAEKVPSYKETPIGQLANRLRGWFQALSYRFESHQTITEEHFEWIIQVPTEQGYERVLVYGVASEANLSDLFELKQVVANQNTDKGWLIASRRISQAVRDDLEKVGNVLCFTLDELIDKDADFTRYFEWLEREVIRRGIDKRYISLAATKDEVDPSTKNIIGQSLYDKRNGWIEGYIDRWLDDPAKEHLSILGEFGTGKTWFALHYAWITFRHYLEAKQRGIERPRLPIYIPLGDFAKARNVDALLLRFFRKHRIPLPNYDSFEQLNRMGKLLIIFDGFDEMASRVNRQRMLENFWELAKTIVPGAKVILTCRTEHFPEWRESKQLLGAEVQFTPKLTGDAPRFEVLGLEKFTEEQVRHVLSQITDSTTIEIILSNPQLREMVSRPIMTELIVDALPDIEKGKPVNLAKVFLYSIRRKLERDIKQERTFTSLADKLYFLSEFSWELISTNQKSLNYRDFPIRIRQLFGSVVQEQKELDHWHHDLLSQTMLIRDDNGNYEPAYRSLTEFFVAYKLAAELGALLREFAEVAREQSETVIDFKLPPKTYTWSEYFYRTRRGTGETVPPLENFVTEPVSYLHKTIGSQRLGKVVLELFAGMAQTESLWEVVEKTRGLDFNTVGYIGGNSLGVLNYCKAKLDSFDYSNTVIAGADLSGADLRNANLTRTDLREANLSNTVLENAKLVETNLLGADIEEWGGISSIAVHPRENLVATAIFDATIKFWRIEDWSQIKSIRNLPNAPMSIAYNADGTLLACAHWDGVVIVWLTSTWEKIFQTSTGFPIYSITFSNDNLFLACGDILGNLWVWKTDKWDKVLTARYHDGATYSLRFNPQSTILATCGADGTIKLLRVGKWSEPITLGKRSGYLRGLCWSIDGSKIISGGEDGKIVLWDVLSRNIEHEVQAHSQAIVDVDWSRDGSLVASGGLDKTVFLGSVQTTIEPIKRFEHDDTVFTIKFTEDNRYLISGSDDWIIKIWDRHNNAVTSIVQSNWRGAVIEGVIGLDENKRKFLMTRAARPWEATESQFDQEIGDPTQLVSSRTEEVRVEVSKIMSDSSGYESFNPDEYVQLGIPIDIDRDEIALSIPNMAIPVLAEFSTSWCGPSRMMYPVLNEVATRYKGKMLLARVDIDRTPRTLIKYNIKGIPTMMIFKNGDVKDRIEGWAPVGFIVSRLVEHMNN